MRVRTRASHVWPRKSSGGHCNLESRSTSSRAEVGEKPLAVLCHLPYRRGWRPSLVVTRTPHNNLDKHGREGELPCRKPINQPPRVSSIATLPANNCRLEALQAERHHDC